MARCGVVIGGLVAAVLGTMWWVQQWDSPAKCDSQSTKYGLYFIIGGWSAQLLLCWCYCCMPALRDGWELDRNDALQIETVATDPDPALASGDTEEMNPLGYAESERLSLVSETAETAPASRDRSAEPEFSRVAV